MGVATPHPRYTEMQPVWETCRDVVAGQRAIHKAGKRYLPELTAETPTDYLARVKRSDFYNATWRTIAGLVGMAFRKPPVVEVPGALEGYLPNIDLAGTSLDSLAKDIAGEVLQYGRVGLLVDHPQMPDNVQALTQQLAEAMGLRPTLKTYDAASIINWRYDTIGNATVLALVVLKERGYIAKDEFSGDWEDRYRVLDLFKGRYRQRLFRIDDKGRDEQIGGDLFPAVNGRAMSSIPFFIIGAEGNQTDIDEPPLIDLVDANLAHYQVNSDYRHGLHFTGLPTLFLAGIQPEDGGPGFYIGGQAAITSPHPDAKGMFIEYSGQGLNAVKDALAGLERRMAVLGARMLADESRQVETLGATQIKRQGENSILASVVGAISDTLTDALTIMAQWAGVSGECKYEISREFSPVPMGAQEMTALVSAWQNGALSEAELYDLFQRGDVVDGAKPFDEHQEEVGQAAIPRPANAA